jgi:hypothetical protein
MSVIAFKPKDNKQWATGEAFCIQCGYEWVAVVESGIVDLECPECKTFKCKFKFEFRVNEGQKVWECNCGNKLFYLTPEGHLCANCGIYNSY